MILTLWFILGAIFGSFSLVLIVRFSHDKFKSSLNGRSHCDKCKHTLNWFDLIPILSYVSTLGKCRYCHKPIAIYHIVGEVLFGLLAVYLAWRFSLPLVAFLELVILTGLIIVAGIDWLSQEVVEIILIGLIPVILVLQMVNKSNLTNDFIGLGIGLVFFLLLYLLGRGSWMGLGDVEVVTVLGFWLGYPEIILAILLAFVLGAFYGVYLLATKKANLGARVPFVPFLVMGGFIALVWGRPIISWYLGGL